MARYTEWDDSVLFISWESVHPWMSLVERAPTSRGSKLCNHSNHNQGHSHALCHTEVVDSSWRLTGEWLRCHWTDVFDSEDQWLSSFFPDPYLRLYLNPHLGTFRSDLFNSVYCLNTNPLGINKTLNIKDFKSRDRSDRISTLERAVWGFRSLICYQEVP